MTSAAPARAAAYRALRRLHGGARLDDARGALPELDDLEERDRRLANELVVGVIKRRLSLDAVVASFATAPLERVAPQALDALRLGAFQLLFLDRVPAYAAVGESVALLGRTSRGTRGFVNAVLHKVAEGGRERLAELSDGDDLQSLAVRWSCPPWLVELLRIDLGQEPAWALLGAANEPPERCLRTNPLKGSREEASAALTAAGFSLTAVEEIPGALLYDGPPLERSRPFADGLVTPQSRGSQLAGLVAADHPTAAAILDAAAAPGTKTSQLAALHPQARLAAVEVDGARAKALRANLARLGAADRIDIIESDLLEAPAMLDGSFDLVLLDAPCTGFGTLAGRPDLRWRRRPADSGRLAAQQCRLLARAARCVRPGGLLTYAVCTVTRAETLSVVESLLTTGGWSLDDLGAIYPSAAHPANGAFLLTLPPDWGSTGFFIARLRRER